MPTDSDKEKTSKPVPSGDIPGDMQPMPGIDHVRREVSIPMRDGTKLHTVLMIPKNADKAPIILDRTPYNASKLTRQSGSLRAEMLMYAFHTELVQAGFILAVQDVRGKYKSEGSYVMNRPVRGPVNSDPYDHVTDAWDSIEWLVQNLPEGNGRVGTLGISYDGFTTLMSLIDPHPALKASVPINPMTDCWTGDDWFHNGAFRQTEALRYIYLQTMSKSSEILWPITLRDDYEAWLDAGSAAGMADRLGMSGLPAWQRTSEHPAFDAYWRAQAVDRLLAVRPVTVPTMHVYSRFDAEDTYGAMAAYLAMEPQDTNNDMNHLVMGPWTHPGVGFDNGDHIGPMKLGSHTASWFRQEVMIPFLSQHLRPGSEPERQQTPVTAFETGSNRWHTYSAWPPTEADGHQVKGVPLYLKPGFKVDFTAPDDPAGSSDEYISDPAKPVTQVPRPISTRSLPGSGWNEWLVSDQRFAGDRPDVLRYTSAPLTEPLRLAGQPIAEFWASTTGTDADWVVKLIDVYPDEFAEAPHMACYQLPISMDILRARYRDDPSVAKAVPAGEVVRYRLALPHTFHLVRPGHRLMVQIQSSWFPLYDRNPQTFVENIMFASPGDYRAANHSVFRGKGCSSQIILPVLTNISGANHG